MSEYYNDLPLTLFPNNIDSFITWLNIAATDGPLIQQYQTALQAGNTTLANQILTQIPSGTQKIIKATDLNKLTQAILAIERFYKTDIEPYTDNLQQSWLNTIQQFSYKGIWQSGTSYVKNNLVSYTIQGLNLLYIGIGDSIPSGTLPTNTQYWRVLTIQGETGVSGDGLSYRQNWNNSTTYYVNDAVNYNDAIWMAVQQNQNQEPTANSSYWNLVMNLGITTYPIQSAQPTNLQVGGLWFNTSNNPTNYLPIKTGMFYLDTTAMPVGGNITYEIGMTWQEFVESSYNTYGFFINSSGQIESTENGPSYSGWYITSSGNWPDVQLNWPIPNGGSYQWVH